jgi:hypothetical protein
MTANTSLVRECLELILMLADALDRKKTTKPLSRVSRQSLAVTPDVVPVALGSETLEGVWGDCLPRPLDKGSVAVKRP